MVSDLKRNGITEAGVWMAGQAIFHWWFQKTLNYICCWKTPEMEQWWGLLLCLSSNFGTWNLTPLTVSSSPQKSWEGTTCSDLASFGCNCMKFTLTLGSLPGYMLTEDSSDLGLIMNLSSVINILHQMIIYLSEVENCRGQRDVEGKDQNMLTRLCEEDHLAWGKINLKWIFLPVPVYWR